MPDQNANQIIEREYLELRSRILQLAASFDRIERADGTGSEAAAENLDKITQGLKILLDEQTEKAKRVQLLFSREYSEDWRNQFGL